MEYKSIKPKKIYEEVSEAILTMIKNGTLKPGDKLLPVHQLAEQFQVGRSAVREALSALRAMGLIEMKQGEGTYVRNFDPSSLTKSLNNKLLMKKEDILNLLEVRKVLEVGAVRAAAAKRTEANLQNMKQWLDEMAKSIGDEKAGEKADFHFHMGIAESSHNNILLELMNHVSEMIAETIGESRRIILYGEQTTSERLLEEHQSIYDAVLKQDVELAQQAMLDHLTNVEHIVTGKSDINS
ncbi:FadR family transcriptional regulator [Bacillus mycoides]|uniref:GntR family transcriptional regulator n=8 Tax=Bacillus cereus group TaxID=86661 RepID=A0A1S9TTT8_BACCE|nr:FadR/GntR family transcriptional regulator [Bacillus mycoides]MBJ7957689.1 FadR family transcriptional regulator [Bacillus cereus group sp. N28]MBK5425751.1 FadR family transcriptional regulator [Bacillus sp. TH30]OOR12971.1 GntR family transcriptional regulator [Bacillus cereus]OTY09733.1 GntR family transcriptional regulator [Bacillus thuringiensis serovar navarrensis]PRD10123.1 FadR family transcriptional regulator [Bacillus sp. MYb56]RAN67510.1 GntR family transcriptional regulator [Ba